mgnify:CR=1 FL=1
MPKKADVKPEDKVAEISKDIVKIEKRQSNIAVTSQEEYDSANEFLIEVKGRINRIKELVEQFNSPHQEIRRTALAAMQANTALFAEPLEKYQAIESGVKRVMGDWQLAENKRIREEEEKARKEQEEAEAAAAEAAKNGEEVAPAPAPAPRPVVAQPKKTQSTESGSSTAKNVVKFEITDVLSLPKKYRDLILEDALKRGHANTIIDKFVKAEGLKFKAKGVRVYEDVDISVKTK